MKSTLEEILKNSVKSTEEKLEFIKIPKLNALDTLIIHSTLKAPWMSMIKSKMKMDLLKLFIKKSPKFIIQLANLYSPMPK